MTEVQTIRNTAVVHAIALLSATGLISPKNSHEFLTLADQIADFINNGTIPSAP